MISKFRRSMALAFTLIFCGLAVALAAIAVHLAAQSVAADRTWAEGLLKSLNMAVIALATFELGLGVHKEYAGQDAGADILTVLRRTVSRFVSIVCIALVLEGLIMVIKYSQMDLAGNLPYPVAIVCSGALLLLSLGGFLHCTRAGEAHGTGRARSGCAVFRAGSHLRPAAANGSAAAGVRAGRGRERQRSFAAQPFSSSTRAPASR
jgi:hypothetical protein